MTKIVSAPAKSYLESYSHMLRMALLDEDAAKDGQIPAFHYWVTCKDFFSDIFYSEQTGIECVDQYRFNWKPGTVGLRETYVVGLDGTKIEAIRGPSGRVTGDKSLNLHEFREPLLAFLHLWEDKLGIPHSTIEPAEKGRLILRFNKRWVYKPAMTSLFLLLVRCGFKYGQHAEYADPLEHLQWLERVGNQPFGQADDSYLNDLHAYKILETVWSEGRCKFGYRNERFTSMYGRPTVMAAVHHDGGIVGSKTRME